MTRNVMFVFVTLWTPLFAKAASLPNCAAKCATILTTGDCLQDNVACLCRDQNYEGQVLGCIVSSCTPSDQTAAVQYFTGLCASLGVTIHPTLPSQSSGTSGSGPPTNTTSQTATNTPSQNTTTSEDGGSNKEQSKGGDDDNKQGTRQMISKGAIAGIVIGCITGIGWMVAVALFLLRRRRNQRLAQQDWDLSGSDGQPNSRSTGPNSNQTYPINSTTGPTMAQVHRSENGNQEGEFSPASLVDGTHPPAYGAVMLSSSPHDNAPSSSGSMPPSLSAASTFSGLPSNTVDKDPASNTVLSQFFASHPSVFKGMDRSALEGIKRSGYLPYMDPDLVSLEDWEKVGVGIFVVGVLRDLYKQRYPERQASTMQTEHRSLRATVDSKPPQSGTIEVDH